MADEAKTAAELLRSRGLKVSVKPGNVYRSEVPLGKWVETLSACYWAFAEKKYSPADGARLLTLFGADERAARGNFAIYAVIGYPLTGEIIELRTEVRDGQAPAFPSVTRFIHAAHWFEREIWSFLGLHPDGHPEIKWLLLHEENWPHGQFPLRKDFPWNEKPAAPERRGSPPMRHVEGEGVYEIPVGPVHAGIIEPGHFRFNALGENILNLEIRLGYQHRGVEKLMENFPLERALLLSERLSGDTAIGHSTAFCELVEHLAEVETPDKGRALRTLALELERLANHVGDLGGISADIGFYFGTSQFGRLRGTLLNLTEMLCGNRYGMGMNVPGGVAFEVDAGMAQDFLQRLRDFAEDYHRAADIFNDAPMVLDRLEGTGAVKREEAESLGLVGPPARACGIAYDVRHVFPFAGYREFPLSSVAVCETGDVAGRVQIRLAEIETSLALCRQILENLPNGKIRVPFPTQLTGRHSRAAFRGRRHAVAIVEGWRGEIAHWAETDGRGRFVRYKIKDPSFNNWIGLSRAVIKNIVPDFPLCNKSFNLSYAGNDL